MNRALVHIDAALRRLDSDHPARADVAAAYRALTEDTRPPLDTLTAELLRYGVQPTGPDDLSGLLHDCGLGCLDDGTIEQVCPGPEWHVEQAADLTARGVTLTGVRSSEVDGQLREAVEQWVELRLAYGRGEDLGPIFDRHTAAASERVRAALTGDTRT